MRWIMRSHFVIGREYGRWTTVSTINGVIEWLISGSEKGIAWSSNGRNI